MAGEGTVGRVTADYPRSIVGSQPRAVVLNFECTVELSGSFKNTDAWCIADPAQSGSCPAVHTVG